jgi:hypothetical protein
MRAYSSVDSSNRTGRCRDAPLGTHVRLLIILLLLKMQKKKQPYQTNGFDLSINQLNAVGLSNNNSNNSNSGVGESVCVCVTISRFLSHSMSQ